MKRPYIVLGPYRSGTSLVSQILKALGVDFGPDRQLWPPNRFNPGGYFERKDVNAVNTRLLESAGRSLRDPGDPATLTDQADTAILSELSLPWPAARPVWALKDPRFCITLKTWLDTGALDGNAVRIVHVIRDEESVVRSALGHPSVLAYCGGDEAAVRAMIRHYRQGAEWHAHALGLPTLSLSFEELVREPLPVIRRIATWLDIDDSRRVARAAQAIGKHKALRHYYLTWVLRVPGKLPRKMATMLARILPSRSKQPAEHETDSGHHATSQGGCSLNRG